MISSALDVPLGSGLGTGMRNSKHQLHSLALNVTFHLRVCVSVEDAVFIIKKTLKYLFTIETMYVVGLAWCLISLGIKFNDINRSVSHHA